VGEINWSWYVNDSAGNLNQTDIWSISLTIDDHIAPNVTIINPLNQNYSESLVLFNLTVVDNVAMDSCLYSLNSGATNYTMSNAGNNWDATNTSIADGSYSVNFYCNDTNNNMNNSESISFGIDTTYPQWSNNKTDLIASTRVGENVYFNITLTELNPDSYIFSWYNGTAWENTTASYTNGQEVSITKTLNADVGEINWSWYVNDSAGNLNQTDIWSISLTIDDHIAPKCDYY